MPTGFRCKLDQDTHVNRCSRRLNIRSVVVEVVSLAEEESRNFLVSFNSHVHGRRVFFSFKFCFSLVK